MHRRKLNIDPDITKCQTSRVGAVIPGTSKEMYYCGIENGDCRYARQFGWDYVCRHPLNDTFLTAEPVASGLIEANSMTGEADTVKSFQA